MKTNPKSSFWKALKNQTGFSLPEVLIGGAILAGVALAGATLFKNQSTAQNIVNADQQLTMYHAALAKTLENTHHCNATFKYKYLASATEIGATDDIDSIRLCESNCNLDADAGTVNVAAAPFISEGDNIDRNSNQRMWQLQSIVPMNSLNNTGVLRLRFNYINTRLGGRFAAKDVLLNLRFNSTNGTFTECFNDQESSVNNLSNDLCDTINATGITSDGRVSYWDEVQQKCLLRGAAGTGTGDLKNCSAQGLMVEGINSNGIVSCRSVGQGFEPGPSTVPSIVDNCANGDKARLAWISGKLRILCQP
jgi:Tfp pilus assembly protein PilV